MTYLVNFECFLILFPCKPNSYFLHLHHFHHGSRLLMYFSLITNYHNDANGFSKVM